MDGATKLDRTLDRIITMVESNITTTARNAVKCTIKNYLDAMDVIPSVVCATHSFIIRTRLFLSRVQCEMFIWLISLF